jgi:hypothetical protein
MQANMKKEGTYVKLFCGLIYRDMDTVREATKFLLKAFGPLDYESEVFDFDHTEYYRSEMGERLFRKFISFEQLIDPGKIADLKLKAIEIENKFADKNGEEYKRSLNIDPGYMELSKVVLASTKNFSHRIYIGKGIFAEVTLIRKDNKFKFLPWTYPDYVNPITLDFFENIRQTYKNQLGA